MKQTLAAVSPAEWSRASAAASSGIIASDAFACAGVVAAFLALPSEIDVEAVIAEALRRGKVVCLPRVVAGGTTMEMHRVRDISKDTLAGAIGVREPTATLPVIEPNKVELVLVPGRAFTLAGERLGRGGGFYDAYLARTKATRVGVGLGRQIIPALPRETHDQCVYALATEAGLAWCCRTSM